MKQTDTDQINSIFNVLQGSDYVSENFICLCVSKLDISCVVIAKSQSTTTFWSKALTKQSRLFFFKSLNF